MAKHTKNTMITDFLDYYFKVPKKEYRKNEIPQHKILIEGGVLYEDNLDKNILKINNSSTELLSAVLKIAEIKTNKKLPVDISEAFIFIQNNLQRFVSVFVFNYKNYYNYIDVTKDSGKPTKKNTPHFCGASPNSKTNGMVNYH